MKRGSKRNDRIVYALTMQCKHTTRIQHSCTRIITEKSWKPIVIWEHTQTLTLSPCHEMSLLTDGINWKKFVFFSLLHLPIFSKMISANNYMHFKPLFSFNCQPFVQWHQFTAWSNVVGLFLLFWSSTGSLAS